MSPCIILDFQQNGLNGKQIFNTARMSVLVNESTTNEFHISRWLRQGDPLSPMLFNTVVEILHQLIFKENRLCVIKGLRLGKGPIVSHSQFADDVIIFIKNTSHSCRGIKVVLKLLKYYLVCVSTLKRVSYTHPIHINVSQEIGQESLVVR